MHFLVGEASPLCPYPTDNFFLFSHRVIYFSHRYHRYHGFYGPSAVGNRQSQTSVRSASQSEGNSVDSETFIRQTSVSSVLSVGDYFPLSVAKRGRFAYYRYFKFP